MPEFKDDSMPTNVGEKKITLVKFLLFLERRPEMREGDINDLGK